METNNENLKTNLKLNCKLHGDYKGYRISIPNLSYGTNSSCPSCVADRKARETELSSYEAAEKFKKAIELAGFPARFINARLQHICSVNEFTNTNVRQNIETNKIRIEHIQTYFNNFKPKTAENMMILGGVSLGKTYTACALGLSLLEKGHSVVYMNTTDMLNNQKIAMYDKEEADLLTKRLAKSHLLILDEFGKKLMTAHETAYFDSIINARYENMVPTVLVSNLNKESILKMVGVRSARRIEENAIVMNFKSATELKELN